ncbi:hypothetical protein OV079_02285 [Nannocystis pusilla]|uniref:Uncharacterized protein n=1 Tax=Nannocystis pusilla TaxID=889268 RepID=A0A9X3EHY4_9BACT|nr:hypothetical protein [Nannocystis pusilla]MCY1004414.1 hypothetical protein [Nannocystis pusilla]
MMVASSRQRPPGSASTRRFTCGAWPVRAGARASSAAICAFTEASSGQPGGASQRTSGIPAPCPGPGPRSSAAHVVSASIGGAD